MNTLAERKGVKVNFPSRSSLPDLFWLAQALTADDDAAVVCLTDAIRCRKDLSPADEGAALQLRCSVIEVACSLLAPQIAKARRQFSQEYDEAAQWNLLHEPGAMLVPRMIGERQLQRALARLDVFLRLAWMIRLGEGHSEPETAHLLGADLRLIRDAVAAAAIQLTLLLGQEQTTAAAN